MQRSVPRSVTGQRAVENPLVIMPGEVQIGWSDAIFEATVSALIVAAVTGLTFIAYKHPKAYSRCYVWLLVISTAAFCCVLTYIAGYSIACATAARFVLPDKLPEMELALGAHALAYVWIFVGYFAWMIYLVLLALLPFILGQGDPDDPVQPKKP